MKTLRKNEKTTGDDVRSDLRNALRRMLSFGLLIIGFSVFGGFSVFAEAGENESGAARQAELSVTLEGQWHEAFNSFLDNSVYTYYQTKQAMTFHFKASESVSGVYLIFNTPCRWRILFPDGTYKDGGEFGFLHEFVRFDRSFPIFRLELEQGSRLAEIYAFTEGELPDWVQTWEPPCDRADLMVMPTHADDEHLWFGGAMPYYAGELGYKVQVVYMTNHYSTPWRCHELLNGLWKVGVRNYPIITDKFPDALRTKASLYAAEVFYGHERVVEFQVEMLRRFAPRVVLAHDINGEYGHGAHRLNAVTLLEALKIYDDPSVYPDSAEKYGITKVQKVYLHLWSENQILVSWSDKILTKFGGKNAYEMAVEGYHCHKSQLRWANYVLEFGKYDCRKFGLAYTTVGYDTPGVNDMFEHVDMSDPADDIQPEDDASGDENDVAAVEAVAVQEEPAEEITGVLSPALLTVVCTAVGLLMAAILSVAVICRRKKR